MGPYIRGAEAPSGGDPLLGNNMITDMGYLKLENSTFVYCGDIQSL